MTHAEYLGEPAEVIDWALQMAGVQAQMERKDIERG